MDSMYLLRELPLDLAELAELALDLRWTWSHAGDALWRRLDPRTWERTENPWMILQDVSQERLEQLAEDSDFKDELRCLAKIRESYLNDPGWYGKTYQDAGLKQSVQVYHRELEPDMVQIELYAEPQDGEEPVCEPMKQGDAIPGVVNGYFYHTQIAATRPAEDFTPRIMPYHQEVRVPIEVQLSK
jgi:hypothetical protein